ncbi:MAG: DUF808 domain-containing protein, partial [Telluria sp.]
LVHGVPALAHMSHSIAESAATVPGIGGALKFIAPTLVDLVAGIIAGGIVLLVVTGVKRLFKRKG